MKALFGIFVLALLASCASTWVDPHLNIRQSQVRVDCPSDPLGLGPAIETELIHAGVGAKPSDTQNAGDLVLRVTYKYKTKDHVTTIQVVKAQMFDERYHSVEARYQWEGEGDSAGEAAHKLVDTLVSPQS